MGNKEDKKNIEDPFMDPLREATLTVSLTSSSSAIVARLAKETKMDLPRIKISKKIQGIFDKQEKSEKKVKKESESKEED